MIKVTVHNNFNISCANEFEKQTLAIVDRIPRMYNFPGMCVSDEVFTS